MSTPPADAVILTDPEWALLEIAGELAIQPLGVVGEVALLAAAVTRSGFDRSKLESALAVLRANKLLVGFGEGALQITQSGREHFGAGRIA